MKKPNRLIYETSPYLLQHAYNPVDWYPWGEEAFQKAKQEDKMIFLSIGYSTCHWCHVMEKESFENEEIAKILNEYYVSIKVDREELPEVDQIYMTALQIMGQQGGWPLNMFLTPDLKPITGGTYFPPERKWGLPSFKEILLKIYSLWKTKKSELFKISEEITQYLNSKNFFDQSLDVKLEHFENIIHHFYKYFDSVKGGFFFSQKNKFPPHLNLWLLIHLYKKTKNPLALEMIEKTIFNIRKGGIYDQIGGGICRYATDHNWLVPHFEKMLYDNALFANVNLEIYKITNNDFYKKISEETLNYIFSNLSHFEGGFYTGEDADSEGEEGKFYVWDKKEVVDILKKNKFSEEEIDLILKYFGITDSGNFENHKNILHINKDNILNEELLKKVKEILFIEREKRIHPFKDKKILTHLNALMISTLCNAYLVLEDSKYLKEALKTYEFIKNYLTITKDFNQISGDKFLIRSYNPEQNKSFSLNGTLTDYSFLGCAFLDLYKATTNEDFIQYANGIKKYIIQNFYKDEIFYETDQNQKNLIIRPSNFYDNIIPSGISATLRLIYQLSLFGLNDNQEEKILEEQLKKFYSIAIRNPFSFSYFLTQFFRYFFVNQQVVIRVNNRNYNFKDLFHFFGNRTLLESQVIYLFQDSKLNLEWLEKKEIQNSDYIIYICENFSCKLPVSDISQLEYHEFF